ncbi:MAG TPA: hypothetical protein VGX69_08530 [Solirubrobacteraceae bacterium]|jgi:hypothetical protein|nr:hypothetical protein [Solirubrobacteraceae bacterium]
MRPRALFAAAASLTALAVLPASAGAAGKTINVKCRGGGSSCNAVIGLTGGASDRKVRIALTDTNFKLVGIVAKPAEVRGAYSLSGGRYSLGGSVFTVTLNAVGSIGKGATLTLKFSSHGKAIKLKN